MNKNKDMYEVESQKQSMPKDDWDHVSNKTTEEEDAHEMNNNDEVPVPLDSIHEPKNLTVEGHDHKSRRYIEKEMKHRENEQSNHAHNTSGYDEHDEHDDMSDNESELSNISD